MKRRPFIYRIAALMVALLLSEGIVAQDTVAADSTRRMPRVGLVLGGGGAKGSAHIGVLKYLEEVGIPISFVAGTSMGSIIGGLYAMGYTPDEMADIISHMDWSTYMSNTIQREDLSIEQRERQSVELLTIPFEVGELNDTKRELISSLPAGAVNSSNLLNLFNRLCVGYQDSMSFDDMPIPFACVATNLLTGDSVVLRKGEFGKAIRSSMSIPGVFAPVQWNNMLLVDGGMVNNFPTDICEQMGADIIIGVEVASEPIDEMEQLKSLPQQVMQYLSIATKGQNIHNRTLCKIYIRPDVTGYNMLSFSTEDIDTLINRGYRMAQTHDAEFRTLKAELEQYGSCEKVLQHPKAQKLMPNDTLLLGSVTYHGIPAEEARQLTLHGLLVPSTMVTIGEIEKTVNKLRGTGYYLNILYKLHERPQDSLLWLQQPEFLLLQHRPVYDIDLYLTPAKPHTIGIGFRYDSEESAKIRFHLGYNDQRATGFRGDVDIDFAYNFKLQTRLSWSQDGVSRWYFDYKYQKSVFDLMSNLSHYWQNKFRLYYSRDFRFFTLDAGLLQDYFVDVQMKELFVGFNIADITPNYRELSAGAFVNMRYDNRDDAFFPSKGTLSHLEGHLYKHNNTFFDMTDPPFGAIQFGWQRTCPLADRWAIIPQVETRWLIGYSNNAWYYNILGGTYSGRYLDQQIAIVGENRTFCEKDLAGVLRLDLRYQLSNKVYATLMSNAYVTHATYITSDDANSEEYGIVETNPYFGAGLRMAYKSFLGPVFFDLFWNSRTQRMGAFFNFGHYF
mgnify:CR=1 FL=1